MLFKALRAYRRESPLSWRLLVFILGFSAFAALFSSGVQLAFNYRQEVSQVDLRIHQFNYVNQAGLAAAVWNFDRYQISSRLNGLVNLPDIKYAEVADPQGKPMIVAGVKPSVLPGKVHRLDLTYMDSTGMVTRVGQLIVIPSLTGVYERVLDYGLLIVAAQSAKTFFVSIFILYIVTQWISRPLTLLSRQIRERNIGNLDQPWYLSRPRWAGENDELNVLVSALNNMQETLRGEVAAIRHMQFALQQSEEHHLFQRGRDAAKQRGSCEADHRPDEDPLAPEARREKAGRRRHDRSGDDIGSQYPGNLILRRRERSLHMRQGDIGDGRIQRLHDGRQHDREGDQQRRGFGRESHDYI